MNDLFEAYIAALAARAVRGSNLTAHAQGGLQYCLMKEGEGRRKCFQTRPDILLKRGGQTVMVIDTKWKRLGQNLEDRKHGISHADIYQMMAYARLYDCPQVMLLYPHHVGLAQPH